MHITLKIAPSMRDNLRKSYSTMKVIPEYFSEGQVVVQEKKNKKK